MKIVISRVNAHTFSISWLCLLKSDEFRGPGSYLINVITLAHVDRKSCDLWGLYSARFILAGLISAAVVMRFVMWFNEGSWAQIPLGPCFKSNLPFSCQPKNQNKKEAYKHLQFFQVRWYFEGWEYPRPSVLYWWSLLVPQLLRILEHETVSDTTKCSVAHVLFCTNKQGKAGSVKWQN